jgi:hypothetical protein
VWAIVSSKCLWICYIIFTSRNHHLCICDVWAIVSSKCLWICYFFYITFASVEIIICDMWAIIWAMALAHYVEQIIGFRFFIATIWLPIIWWLYLFSYLLLWGCKCCFYIILMHPPPGMRYVHHTHHFDCRVPCPRYLHSTQYFILCWKTQAAAGALSLLSRWDGYIYMCVVCLLLVSLRSSFVCSYGGWLLLLRYVVTTTGHKK